MKIMQRCRRKSAGFSLVEVTLAIGITAVALVSLMGMLPKGMKTLQKASDQAVMGRIHQQVLGELQLTPWEDSEGGASPLDSFNGQIRFYDDQGIELESKDAGSMTHVYTARIVVPSAGEGLPASVGANSFTGVKVPGEQVQSERFSRLVLVEITGNVDPQFLRNPGDGFDRLLTYPGAIYTYRAIISKMGRTYGSEEE